MRESVFVSKKYTTARNASYLVERRSDPVYSSDQDLAGEVGPAVDSHHQTRTVADFGDRTEAVKVGTLKLPAAIHSLSVL